MDFAVFSFIWDLRKFQLQIYKLIGTIKRKFPEVIYLCLYDRHTNCWPQKKRGDNFTHTEKTKRFTKTWQQNRPRIHIFDYQSNHENTSFFIYVCVCVRVDFNPFSFGYEEIFKFRKHQIPLTSVTEKGNYLNSKRSSFSTLAFGVSAKFFSGAGDDFSIILRIKESQMRLREWENSKKKIKAYTSFFSFQSI